MISIVLKNESNEAISYLNGDSLVSYQVNDSQGKPVPSKKEGVMPGQDRGSLGLRAGEEASWKYDLTSHYILKEKGRYTLTVYRTFNEFGYKPWGLLMIKEVNFYVGEAPNPFRTDD